MKHATILTLIVCTLSAGVALAEDPGPPELVKGKLTLEEDSAEIAEAWQKERRRLEKELSAAEVQMTMNMVSAKLAFHWDQRLDRLEKEVAQWFEGWDRHPPKEKEFGPPNPTRSELFVKSTVLWRAYRDAQVDVAGIIYEGGSIAPLIRSQQHIKLTRERIADLAALSMEGEFNEYLEE